MKILSLMLVLCTYMNIFSQDKIVLNPDQYIVKEINYDYDLISGKVNYVYYQKGQDDQLIHKYTYDGDNRLTQVHTGTNGRDWTRDAAYEYYAHGPLAKAQVGALNVETSVYAYTLQGWIKGVKGENFSYALGYNDTDYKAINAPAHGGQHLGLKETPIASNASGTSMGLYNGNIATWASLNPKINATTWTQQFTYDQLNRINAGSTLGSTHVDQFRNTYSYDANGNIKSLERWNKAGAKMDEFTYNYEDKQAGYLQNTNKLRSVDDNPAYSGVSSTDLDDQGLDNYTYDDIGNLSKDTQEDIARIEWTVYGKVKAVYRISDPSTKLPTGDKPHLFFEYDAMGNRVTKYAQAKDGKISKTSYIRDASGNVMSTYTSKNQTSLGLGEQYLYGSSRLGVLERGSRSYELTDHLGNVRAVVTDQATVSSATDYYPFGMTANAYIPNGYRYGYNTQEKVDEIADGHYTAMFWEYDSRLGRRWNLDPKPQVRISDYAAVGDSPIWATDVNGDKWKTDSDKAKAKDIDKSLGNKKDQLTKQADKLTAKADKATDKGKTEKAQDLLAQADRKRNEATEMARAQAELGEIDKSETEFTFKENLTNPVSHTYMDEKGTIVIEFGSTANAVHELTHAYQHISGDVEFVAGTGGAYYVDINDEIAAYQRQFIFEPTSVTLLTTDYKPAIKKSSDIVADFVIKIWATQPDGSKVYPYAGSRLEPDSKPGSPASKRNTK